ncbi:uncharacterized protein [Atheta coriaria]|uniref:uncharacterized protein n=1 Tax=Dalotia coriaria TaxID=877792 RepID=UPI0031F46D77
MFEDFIQKHSKARFQERRYVVMFNSTKDKEFYQFFASNYLKFVSDMLVVKDIPEREGEFALFTHQFVGLENNDKIVLINEWSAISQSFASNSTLYPDKLKNLQGKRLIVGGEKYLPITDPVNLKGPETVLLVEYAKKHNITLLFDTSFDYLGVFRSNWTGTGYMDTLLQDKIDLIAYAVYIEYSRTLFGDFSRPLCEIRVTCIVPKPRLINEWMIFNIFTYGVWLLIGANMIAIMIIFKILKIYFKWIECGVADSKKLEYLIAFRILLAQPSNLATKTLMERVFFSVLLSCFILIQTFFNSKFSSYIAVPTYIDEINSLAQLASSDILWYSKFNDKGKIISTETTEPMVTLYKKFRLVQNQISDIHDERYAYAVDESFASHFFTIDDYFTLQHLEDFKVMKEYIIGHQYTAFLLRRNSIWLIGIDKLCAIAMEHGLIKYWEKDAISDPLERRIQNYLGLARTTTETPKIIQLDLRLFQSFFIIWSIGLFLAAVVFILELKQFKCNCDIFSVNIR